MFHFKWGSARRGNPLAATIVTIVAGPITVGLEDPEDHQARKARKAQKE